MQVPSVASRIAATSLAAATTQQAPVSQDADRPLAVERVDPVEGAARLQKYLQALGAPLRMGQAASHVARALVSTMQSLLQERPDLAHASFDFQAADGAVTVVSQDMGTGDRLWLEGKLNANDALREAVGQFHDDAVDGYALWADASGHPLTPEEMDTVARKADGLTGFLELFSKLGADAARRMFSDGTYYAPDGAPVSFAQDPSTAVGFLAFMRGADTLAAGSARWVAPDGHSHVGVLRGDIFANDRVMPNFFPGLDRGPIVSVVA